MKIAFSVLLLVLSTACLYGQDTLPAARKRDFPPRGGVAAYYFWEEDSNGFLLAPPRKAFLQNYLVTIPQNAEKNGNASLAEVLKAVDFFAAEPGTDAALDEYYFEDSLKQLHKLQFSLERKTAQAFSSVLFRRQKDKWTSSVRANVLYFQVDAKGKMRYSSSADSIVLFNPSMQVKAAGQYVVYNYLDDSGQLAKQEVINYEGKDVTVQFREQTVAEPVRMLLFINGYRGPKRNDEPTDGVVMQKDRFGYWFKLDNQFTDKLKPVVSYYLDGSLPISTSNHKTKRGFAWSYLRTKLTLRRKKSKLMARRLNTIGNNPGFDERMEKGKLGGLAFLAARCDAPDCSETRDTIDIVCHSMGYAYALGFLEVAESRFVLRNMYILAPENACYKGYDWSKFQHVWQYGSDLDQPDASPISKQDGIAPQCAVKGLDKLPKEKGGRAFFPKDWPGQNFVDSHMIYSYDWIFERITQGEVGFVTN